MVWSRQITRLRWLICLSCIIGPLDKLNLANDCNKRKFWHSGSLSIFLLTWRGKDSFLILTTVCLVARTYLSSNGLKWWLISCFVSSTTSCKEYYKQQKYIINIWLSAHQQTNRMSVFQGFQYKPCSNTLTRESQGNNCQVVHLIY